MDWSAPASVQLATQLRRKWEAIAVAANEDKWLGTDMPIPEAQRGRQGVWGALADRFLLLYVHRVVDHLAATLKGWKPG